MIYRKNLALLAAMVMSLSACNATSGGGSAIQSGTSINNGVPPFPVDVALVDPEAGIDYPTDIPGPTGFDGVRILTIESHRVRVPEASELVEPAAGIDYPTDTDLPVGLRGRAILVLEGSFRLPLRFAKPHSDVITLELNNNVYVDIREIVSIEKAVAGIDFPTDGPANLDRDFYVLARADGKRIKLN